MVSFAIEQFRLELQWLRKLKRELAWRAAAVNPNYASHER
jgi:hypothetical protein